MPILANTKVLPELIPVTYAKIRAEIEREISRTMPAMSSLIALDLERNSILVDATPANGTLRLPRFRPDPRKQSGSRQRTNSKRSAFRDLRQVGPELEELTPTIPSRCSCSRRVRSIPTTTCGLYPLESARKSEQ